MPEFMDVHTGMVGITPDGLHEAHQADLAIQGEEQVNFKKAWADPESGMVFCLSEAPSAEAVKRIHERAGHPVDRYMRCPSRRSHSLGPQPAAPLYNDQHRRCSRRANRRWTASTWVLPRRQRHLPMSGPCDSAGCADFKEENPADDEGYACAHERSQGFLEQEL